MINASNISLFENAFAKESHEVIPVDMFFENIRNGTWQDIVLPLRALRNEARTEAKKRVPCVTLAGTFSSRRDDGLVDHSGLIAIDIDDVEDPAKMKERLSRDPYVYAAFASIGGKGLCVVFKITPTKHREAFRGISEYLFNAYKVVVDPTSINVSRLRFVSYDPDLYLASDSVPKFTMYPKDKEPKKIERIAFVRTDFDEIMNQIVTGRINLCENYHEWVRIAFALADHFGEAGRSDFHMISSMSAKYEPSMCDRQYVNCLKHRSASTKSTIATFYYYCKLAGVSTYSERTRKIVHSAYNGKKGGLTADQVTENLKKFEEIEGDDVLGIVKQIQENDIKIDDTSVVDQLEMFVRQNYSLKCNEITAHIENNGIPLKKRDVNSIYIRCKKIFDTVSYDLIDRLIDSEFVPIYNPIQDFFLQNKEMKPTGQIEKLFSSIQTKDPEYLLHFGRKWIVGMISAAFWTHNPLMLTLSGEKQRTGKTEFFRRLLPKELQTYYGESKLDAGKDDYILMGQKLLLVDDEMGGKSKKESKLLKELSSKQIFSLRVPYGRGNEDIRRLATLGGTTNDNEILNDPTGNRRIIPVHVFDINHQIYNSVDKKMLFMEAYHLWADKFEWELNADDVNWLNKDADSFRETCIEAELFLKFFEIADGSVPGDLEMPLSEIKTEIELDTKQKLNVYRLGAEMKRMGVEQKHKKMGNTTQRLYVVRRTMRSMGYPTGSTSLTAGGWRPILDHLEILPENLF